jgi:EAL domain-containing protein (putative c-di-GMP-specific phosphodiesterase class I)
MLESWVDLASLKQEEGQLAQLLFDQVTDLPTVPLLFPDMRKILDEQGQLGFLYLEVVQYSAIERIYGWQTFDEIVKDIADCLLKFKQERLRQNDMMAEVMISGNAFVFVLSPPRTKEWLEYSDLDKVRKRIYHSLESFLKERLEPSIYEKFGCYIGCTVIDYDPSIRFERLVYQALDEAFADATLERERDAKKRSARLKDVIKTRKVQSVYQPILDLKDKKVIGYEALSRGPVGEFEDPDHLFKVAYEANVVWRLERLCREQALRGIAPHIKEGELLFLNVEPDAVHDPHFRSSESIAQLTECNLTPERIVLELTERMAIRDFAVFRQALEIFRSIGFKVAVDDVGCAYSGLQSIAELKPDFIKVDMSLVHGLESDSIKRDLVEAVYKFSEQIGVCLVAEGVECEEELEVIQDIGIRYAQGYFFAFPDNPPALVDWLSIGG